MTIWNTAPPTEPGLYIARAFDRFRAYNARLVTRAPFVRCWTGHYWTAPTAVEDLHLPGRVPDATWRVARDQSGRVRKVEWLEPFNPAEIA